MLPALEELVLVGNPMQEKYEKEHGGVLGWAEKVLQVLPNLRRLDGIASVAWRLKIVEGNEKELRELFDRIDADGSGDLDMHEVTHSHSLPSLFGCACQLSHRNFLC